LTEDAVGEPVLEVQDLHAGYGKKGVLHGVSLAIGRSEIVVVIGPNGAGKSTLLKAVAGLLRPSAGRISFKRSDVTHLPAHQRARAGLGYAMQAGAIFPSLSVADHLALGSLAPCMGEPRSGGVEPSSLLPADVVASGRPAGLLSGGQRQALAIATVLSRPNLDLLLCDEPSSGMAPAVARELLKRVLELSSQMEIAVLCWVEQRIGDVLSLPLVKRAVLLREGRRVAETDKPTDWLDADVLAKMTFGDAR
jgi:ABC-type branched-subunit amino acid transport system ATPase component